MKFLTFVVQIIGHCRRCGELREKLELDCKCQKVYLCKYWYWDVMYVESFIISN